MLTPNPKCLECKGTGMIVLFSSSCKCDCIKRTESRYDKYFIELDYVNPYGKPGSKYSYPSESVHKELKGDI